MPVIDDRRPLLNRFQRSIQRLAQRRDQFQIAFLKVPNVRPASVRQARCQQRRLALPVKSTGVPILKKY